MRKYGVFDLDWIRQNGGIAVPPLGVRILGNERTSRADALVDITWRDRTSRFVAELKADARPLTLQNAVGQVLRDARGPEPGFPLIIAPFLSSRNLDKLLAAGVSGIDLSGNAAIEVPGELFFYKTGNPNRFPERSPIRSAYRGDGSLAARVLLLQREFRTVSGVLESIRARGGTLTLGMVSKVLRRLQEDLVIERPTRNTVRLIQPERLLDGLLQSYQPPRKRAEWTGRLSLPTGQLLARMTAIAGDGGLVRSGVSSAIDYATWAGEPIIECYCRMPPGRVLEAIGDEPRETTAFANLRLIQTDDQRVYFDARPNLAASPIQAWLEMACGDKRQKEVAARIRTTILGITEPTP